MKKITQSKISYYDGELCLKTNGNPTLVDISYRGIIRAESNMPDGFIVLEKRNRIIIIRFNQNQMPEHIFSYDGTFKIKTARVYDGSGASILSEIDKLSHKWGHMIKTNNTWNLSSSTWESHYENDKYINKNKFNRPMKKSVIMNNNLSSSMGEFYLPDGSLYSGSINYDSRGFFRTGSSKTKDSVSLTPSTKKINIRRKNG
jgi:hypothetical protein